MRRPFLFVNAVVLWAGAELLSTCLMAQPPQIEIIAAPTPASQRILPDAEHGGPASQRTSEEERWEWARLQYHVYRRHEYPEMMRQLNAAIELAEAELAALDRQIAEYESISRPVTSRPYLVTLESARLRRMSVQQQLDALRRLRLARRHTFLFEQLLKQQEILFANGLK
jgi:hypothetical protein